MPIHDWTRVRAGTYHFFHQQWVAQLCSTFNTGGLPPGYFAMSEQNAQGPIPDVLTLHTPPIPRPGGATTVGLSVETSPPKTRFSSLSDDPALYSRRADRVAIRFDEGDVVSIIEVVSPGNKDSKHAIRSFVRKARGLIRAGIHVMVIDPFPPGPRDPSGVHTLIWSDFRDESFPVPGDKPLTLASYAAGTPRRCFVEPVAVGDSLPDMPLFLTPEIYVPCPLERTYAATWAAFPVELKRYLEPTVTPESP